MGLYSGWNALGLGQSIESGLQSRRQREQDIYDRFGSILPAAGEFFDDSLQRRRALELANRNGVENAGVAANSMSGADFLKYVLGEKSRMDADRKESEIYARNRKDAQRDYARDRAHALDDYGTKRRDEALDKGFAVLAQNYQTAMSKYRGNIVTRADLEELNSVTKALADFTKAHPEYGAQLPAGFYSGTDAAGNPVPVTTFEDWTDQINGLLEPDGTVDPKKMKALKQKMIDSNVYATLMENPDVKLKWQSLAEKQTGDPTTRDADNLGSGNVKTKEDAKKALQAKQRADALRQEKANLERAVRENRYYDTTRYEQLGGDTGTSYYKSNARRKKKEEKEK